MEEIEFKIDSILDQHLLAVERGCIEGQSIASKEIAKEVKDIAIEFAEKCFDEYADQQMSFGELFDQFIKERYK